MLTKSDNHLLKGIAILSIMLHNLLHLLPGAVAENEFTFSARNIQRVLFEFHHSQEVWRMIASVFSHFGHYGVPIFLFLSGYGLVMKYEKSLTQAPSTLPFLWQHMKKLWGLMIPGFVVALFFLTDWHTFTLSFGKSNPWLTLAFLGNFFEFDTLIYGPWWFFSLMLQLYLLYRCIFYRWKRAIPLWSIVGLSILAMWLANESNIHLEISDSSLLRYLRVSALGHLLPFALGISAARWGGAATMTKWKNKLSPILQQGLSLLTSLLGLVLLYCSAFHFTFWLFSPLFAIMAVVPWASLLRHPSFRMGWEHWGIYSSALFVYHPIIRAEILPRASQAAERNDVATLGWSIALFITLAYILARADRNIRSWWKQWQQSRSSTPHTPS